jgi:DNA-binding winged helix-turn-helix (wHTH) protein
MEERLDPPFAHYLDAAKNEGVPRGALSSGFARGPRGIPGACNGHPSSRDSSSPAPAEGPQLYSEDLHKSGFFERHRSAWADTCAHREQGGQAMITRRVSYAPMHHSDARRLREHRIYHGYDAVIRFGRFRVLPRARQLLVDGRPVALGARAFDLLVVLIKAAGTVVPTRELLNSVWPDTTVEEANLKVQMWALRRALGEERDAIKTVHGRGYLFVSGVSTASAEPMPETPQTRAYSRWPSSRSRTSQSSRRLPFIAR